MLNLKEHLKNGTLNKLSKRGISINVDSIINALHKRNSLISEIDDLRRRLKILSNEYAKNKETSVESNYVLEEILNIKKDLKEKENDFLVEECKYEEIINNVPNIPLDSVPIGESDKDNVVIKNSHDILPIFDFNVLNHVDLNDTLDIFDFERGAKISGSGFYFYKNKGAILEWALIQYMINYQIIKNRQLVLPPLVVKESALYCTGQSPKFLNQIFNCDNRYLIPTSETPLVAMFQDEILNIKDLPIRMVGFSPCFRKEAGSYGVEDRGIIRTHQFNKVEMITICQNSDFMEYFDEMVETAENILKNLKIPYRLVELCTGDLPFASQKTIDIEVWLPGQGRYYECSSISACGDFQSRRGKIRVKDIHGEIEYPYTLNGSGLATSRLMVAILENNQNEDGSVNIPDVLIPYTGFSKL